MTERVDCSWISEHLTAYEDGECVSSDKAVVEEHLRLCAVCRGQAQELRQSWMLFQQVNAADRLPAKLEDNPYQRHARLSWIFAWRWAAPALAFAGAVLVLGLKFIPQRHLLPVSKATLPADAAAFLKGDRIADEISKARTLDPTQYLLALGRMEEMKGGSR